MSEYSSSERASDSSHTSKGSPTHRLARWVLATFVLTFIVARVLVYLIESGALPDLYWYVGQTHVHHLNYGIFLLAGVGAFLIFIRPTGRKLTAIAAIYGIGLGLTFDEFGMWLHLGGGYWQRASFDAVVVIAAVLGLIAAAPSLQRFRPRHWVTGAIVAMAIILFGVLVVRSYRLAEHKLIPRLEQLENRNRP